MKRMIVKARRLSKLTYICFAAPFLSLATGYVAGYMSTSMPGLV